MKLINFKDIHKNQRAFIACNGPSLNDIPMEKLQGEVVFGLNRGYLKDGLPITYLVNIVKSIAEQWGSELLAVPCRALFTNHLDGKHVVKMKFGGVGKIFQTDLTKPMYRGNTVTYVALQLAYWMGFTKVYCIGLDHTFTYDNTKKDQTHHRAVINVGKDLNHFDPNYFGNGSNWLPYEPKAVELAYSLARDAYAKSSRELYNASTYTALSSSIMLRKKFEDIFEGEEE